MKAMKSEYLMLLAFDNDGCRFSYAASLRSKSIGQHGKLRTKWSVDVLFQFDIQSSSSVASSNPSKRSVPSSMIPQHKHEPSSRERLKSIDPTHRKNPSRPVPSWSHRSSFYPSSRRRVEFYSFSARRGGWDENGRWG